MKKEILSKYVYNLYKNNILFKNDKYRIKYGFLYNNFSDLVFKNTYIKDGIIPEEKENIICVLIDSEEFKNSIFFTDTALYVENSLIREKSTQILYKDIKEIKRSDNLIIALKNEKEYKISNLWNFEGEYLFLNYVSKEEVFDELSDENIIKQSCSNLHASQENLFSCKKTTTIKKENDTATNITFGNVSNAATNYGVNKFQTPRGHGFVAERVNHLYDILTGNNSFIVGDNNAKNGADRIVNGISIQSKYCSTGSKCIQDCFHNGKFRYINPDGTPMQIEVPSDKYDSAVEAMKNRIRRGEVPNVANPEEAKNIVRKGHFTYEQVKNIAKAGTIESIAFDSVNGAIIATTNLGISVCMAFAISMWNEESTNEALKKAAQLGLKVGGSTFVTAVLSSQLSRTQFEHFLVGSSESIIKILGPKASAVLVNAFSSGKNIYGAAAMKKASKLLRGNMITTGVSLAVLSTGDIIDIFRGRISGAQFFKNVANTASTLAGGSIGWIGGAKAGAFIGSCVMPGFGTTLGAGVGAFLGSLNGGRIASKVSNKILDNFIKDDADRMIKILENIFSELSKDYLLNKKEVEIVINNLREELTLNILKSMFASDNKRNFAEELINPHIKDIVKRRKKITLPDKKMMCQGLRICLEEL